MRMIELNKIDSARQAAVGHFADTDEPGENANANAEVVESRPVTVNVDTIRCYYPRKEERPGTRITFNDGGGFAVTQTYDEVKTLIAALDTRPRRSN